jgi:hypothetical protein
MDILKELERFIDDEGDEDLENIVHRAQSIMLQKGKKDFDDEMYDILAQDYGSEFLADKLDKVIEQLGVENKLRY